MAELDRAAVPHLEGEAAAEQEGEMDNLVALAGVDGGARVQPGGGFGGAEAELQDVVEPVVEVVELVVEVVEPVVVSTLGGPKAMH